MTSTLQNQEAPAAFATDDNELYLRAKEEGALNLYAAGPRELSSEWMGLFQSAYPHIKIELSNGTSDGLAGKIDDERGAGAIQADLAILQTVQDFVRWKHEGALIAVHPDGFEKIPSAFKDDDGAYVGVQVYSLIYGYNSALVPTSSVPKIATDFLHPRFDGKIILGYPSRDEVVLYLMSTIVEKYGWQFMPELMKLKPKFVIGHAGVAREIANGDYSVTFDAIAKLFGFEIERGRPVAVAVSSEDPMPVWAQTAAVIKGCPHPNAAMLYLDWYLRPEQQQKINSNGSWSPRSDVAPPMGLEPLSHYQLANDFRSFILNHEKVAELKRRLEEYTGIPEGPIHM